MPGQNPRQGWESVDLSNGVKLAFTRSSSNLPITKIRLTETEVCMRKEEFGVTKGRDPYPLYESDECTYLVKKMYLNELLDTRLHSIFTKHRPMRKQFEV